MLGVKTIIWGECGHAWRAGILTPALNGPMDDFDPPYPYHISQYMAHMLRRGAFNGKLDKTANDQYLVTYHDPCNPARAGQLLEEPRELLRAPAAIASRRCPRTRSARRRSAAVRAAGC